MTKKNNIITIPLSTANDLDKLTWLNSECLNIYRTIYHEIHEKFTLMYSAFVSFCHSTITPKLKIKTTEPKNNTQTRWSGHINIYPCSREGFYSLRDKTDVLSPDLVKPRWREIKCYHARIIIKFVRHLYNATAEMHVTFQSAWKSLNPNLAASRLNEIIR